DGAGPDAFWLAHANDWPLLAEPSSGACGGRNGIPAYRLLLDEPTLGGQVDPVVLFGRPTLSRPVQALLSRPEVEILVIAPRGAAWPDAGRAATQVLTELPPLLLRGNLGAGMDWLARWRRAGEQAARAVTAVLDGAGAEGLPSGPAVARVVAARSGEGAVLVVGASNPVRDLELVAERLEEAPLVLANRGLAGIDGTVSTAVGIALGLARPVRAYVGDLTFLHDVGGLLVGPLDRRPDLQVVVANDDGGSIFATLEHGGAPADLAERVFGTPHGADLGALCAGYGVAHTRVEDLAGLDAALARPIVGLSVVEVVVDRVGRRDLHVRLGAAVHAAVATPA
ncbi:MAG: 2-succinyl-5-enolpyruvyl-6-hydroxy-3-cyclohexene-1-carboxylate synthase, partial [Cellulomonadaceae bacterium]|nr:2-succinyl-5-enolpyruvyl-6-hydroxy-3-cyclohexene-1-carboxylate synthase [Cellulomonadaceae bacterium]